MKRKLVVALVATLCAAVAGCGGGEPAAEGDPERYCELTAKLDARFDTLASSDADTAEEVKAELETLVEDTREDFEALIRAAPEDARPELAQGLDILERLGEGDLDALNDLEALDDSKSTAFEKEHCTESETTRTSE